MNKFKVFLIIFIKNNVYMTNENIPNENIEGEMIYFINKNIRRQIDSAKQKYHFELLNCKIKEIEDRIEEDEKRLNELKILLSEKDQLFQKLALGENQEAKNNLNKQSFNVEKQIKYLILKLEEYNNQLKEYNKELEKLR
jgi:hypothetical protein